jgi:ribonuclease P protein component
MAKKFTLGKHERLKSRKTIELLFSAGKKFVDSPYRVYYLYSEFSLSHLQFGVGVSGKIFRKAVDRNRIKRLTKEAYRLQKTTLQQKLKAQNRQLSVFFIYNGRELPDQGQLNNKVGAIIRRLEKITDGIK